MNIIQHINQLTITESICTILPYIILWTLLTVFLYKKDYTTVLRVGSILLLAIWIYFTWEYTTFGRNVGAREFSLIPFAQLYQIVKYDMVSLLMSAWFNVLLFVPFGILLPEVLPDRYGRKRRMGIVIASAFAMSVAIEGCQGIWGLGLVETDDVMCNTLGACVGYGCYWVKCRGVKRYDV